MKNAPILAIVLALIFLFLPGCHSRHDETELEQHQIVVTGPKVMDVIVTQQYVCQIHSKRHIEVRVMQSGFLEGIPVKEGQRVKEGQEMFKVVPILYKTKLDAERAEAKLAELERDNAKRLYDQKVVSIQEVALFEAKLARAKAKVAQAEAELNFTTFKAPFDGIIDRQEKQHGSLIKEGDVLTTLSDNSLMWVYFNVPEKQYIAYMNTPAKEKEEQKIELLLANGDKFKEPGKIGAIGSKINNENGNNTFRADFRNPDRSLPLLNAALLSLLAAPLREGPLLATAARFPGRNPDRLLRHGMTGTILIHRTAKDSIVIPQRATFEILDKQYVYVVDKDEVVHQREIKVLHELEDIYVIQSGLGVNDRFVYEGIRQVRDGQKVEYELRPVEKILAQLKYRAE